MDFRSVRRMAKKKAAAEEQQYEIPVPGDEVIIQLASGRTVNGRVGVTTDAYIVLWRKDGWIIAVSREQVETIWVEQNVEAEQEQQ